MKLVIQWIPSHSGISGNEYVDSLAKEAHNILDLTSIPIPFKESTTICHRAIWDSWRVERETELKFSNLGTLREGNKMAPLETFIKDRKVNTSIIRLRIGHSSLRQHLYRLRLEISPLCECQQEETVQHIIMECPRYFSARTKMKHFLFNLGVPFNLKNILGREEDDPDLKRKIYRHLAVYLKSTGLIDRI